MSIKSKWLKQKLAPRGFLPPVVIAVLFLTPVAWAACAFCGTQSDPGTSYQQYVPGYGYITCYTTCDDVSGCHTTYDTVRCVLPNPPTTFRVYCPSSNCFGGTFKTYYNCLSTDDGCINP